MQDLPDEIYAIDVKHIPTDWNMLTATFLAALLGSLTAFLLGIMQNYFRQNYERQNLLNLMTSTHAINIEKLINLKEQFLTKYKNEFAIIAQHAGSVSPVSDLTSKQRWETEIGPIWNKIKREGNANGLLMRWDTPTFSSMPDMQKLAPLSRVLPVVFVDHIRAADSLNALSNISKMRLSSWNIHMPKLKSGNISYEDFMFVLYDLIVMRQIIEEAVNDALRASMLAALSLRTLTDKLWGNSNWLTRKFGYLKFTKFNVPEDKAQFLPENDAFKKDFVIQR